jgi:hypothetical protein
MITNECISCGACEPECPNNAISQGETIYIIDPKLCTECVGFHDVEACAAVCPVDCCVTDPNNIESEEVLIARARALHPDTQFGDTFESRFRKGQAKPAAGPTKSPVPPPPSSPASQQAAPVAASVIVPRDAAPAQAPAEHIAPEIEFVKLPEIDSWQIPLRCYKCQQTHVQSVRNFMVGNVIFCPHCHKSTVVRDNVNFHLRSLLTQFYENWDKEQSDFKRRREQELAAFIETRAKEAELFKSSQQRKLDTIRQQLKELGGAYDAPGKPMKKGSRFAWG